MKIGAAAAVLVAVGAGAWWYAGPRQGSADATSSQAGGGAAPPVSPRGSSLPTLPDGRFDPKRVTVTTKTIKTIDGAGAQWALDISPDLTRVAVPEMIAGRIGVIVPGEPVPKLPPAPPEDGESMNILDPRMTPTQRTVVFSPDSRRLAWVRPLGARRATVVVDGRQQGPEYTDAGNFVFSPDSKRLAHVATLADWRAVVVLDGEEGKPYGKICGYPRSIHPDDAQDQLLVFSPDSRRLAYAAFDRRPDAGDPIEPKLRLVVDGAEQLLEGQDLTDIVWSPDSAHVACAVGGVLYVDGKVRHTAAGFIPHSLRFSADGERLIYVVRDAEGSFRVMDADKPGKPYRFINARSLHITPEGSVEFNAGVGEEGKYAGDIGPGAMVHFTRPVRVVGDTEQEISNAEVLRSADGRHRAWVTNPRSGPAQLMIDDIAFDAPRGLVRFRWASPDTLHALVHDHGKKQMRVVEIKLVKR